MKNCTLESPPTPKYLTDRPASRGHASPYIKSCGCLPAAIASKTSSRNIPRYRAQISSPVLTMEHLWPRIRTRGNCPPLVHPSHSTTRETRIYPYPAYRSPTSIRSVRRNSSSSACCACSRPANAFLCPSASPPCARMASEISVARPWCR